MSWWAAVALVAVVAVPCLLVLVARRDAARHRGEDPTGPGRWKNVLWETWESDGPPGSTGRRPGSRR